MDWNLGCHLIADRTVFVALLVSAWIEIKILSKGCSVNAVALLVSAWIEIVLVCLIINIFKLLHSSWVHGLKLFSILNARSRTIVALLVSAWIEIVNLRYAICAGCVALLVSAWIEMYIHNDTAFNQNVALLVSAWIEIKEESENENLVRLLHSSWVHGLKLS